MAFGDNDLGIFFQDGDLVTRTAPAAPFMAHFDIPEVLDTFSPMQLKAGEMAARPTIRYATAASPDLVHGETITVRGTQYRVRSPRKEGDGQTSVAELSVPGGQEQRGRASGAGHGDGAECSVNQALYHVPHAH